MSMSQPLTSVVIRLSPGVEFSADAEGRPQAHVKRGASVTRYAIDPNIQAFLECFRTPQTLQQVADQLGQAGFRTDNVLEFGKKMLKTPLLEFDEEQALQVPPAAPLLQAMELELLHVFKDRKFDGVYLVRDAAGRQLVAKLLRAPLELGVAVRIQRRLSNEHSIFDRLREVPGVARSAGLLAAPAPCLLLEFVPGEALTQALTRKLDFQRRLGMAAQAAATIATVHAHGIIHGDLHTSNFLVDEAHRMCLIDFDCSSLAGADFTPRVGGAPHFLPPERMTPDWHTRSTAHATAASDVYQLGVIAYYLLSGAPPYRGKQYAELMAAIGQGDCAPLVRSKEGEPVPAAISAIIHACLARLPQERPAAAELAAVLARYREQA
jgi:eukaryotic-like serine/threonine-protein kinase